MPGLAAICADVESLKHPEVLGLGDVALEEVPWLDSFSAGSDLRRALKDGDGIEEVWLLSAEDVAPINLAAALRKDGYRGIVHVVMENANGSSMSRATAAGVSDVRSPEGFVRWFSLEATRRRRMEEASSLSFADVKDRRPSLGSEGCAAAAQECGGAGESIRSGSVSSAGLAADPHVSIKRGNPRHASSAATAAQSMIACPKGSGRLIVVVGGSGGVGKTTVAACLASCATRHGLKTLIVDGDLQFGCMHQVFGEGGSVTLDEAVADEGALARLASAQGKDGPVVLAAPCLMEKSETLSADVAHVVSAALGWFDLVIVDTSGHWSDMQPTLIEMAMCTLFLIDQRPSSMRTCRHAMDLCQRMGLATGSFSFALNRCSKDAAINALDASCALGGVHVHEIADGGSEVEELCADGAAALLASSPSAFARSVEHLARQVMPEAFGDGASEEHTAACLPWLRHLSRGRRRQRRRSRGDHEIIVRTGTSQAGGRSPMHAQVVHR